MKKELKEPHGLYLCDAGTRWMAIDWDKKAMRAAHWTHMAKYLGDWAWSKNYPEVSLKAYAGRCSNFLLPLELVT